MNKAFLLWTVVLGSALCKVYAGAGSSPYSIHDVLDNIGVSVKTPAVVQNQISGTVRDVSGSLAGVTVTVVGSTVVVQTDRNGIFLLNAPRGSTLRFSALGYHTKEVVASSNQLSVQLEAAEETIDEVIVTAMGITRERKSLGYAAQDLGAEELMKNKTANIINSLAGKIAGVNVTQTSGGAGAGASIILRGGTSLQRDNQPLFVVDGLIYDNSSSINGNSGFDGAQSTNSTYSNRVMDINPEDIENVSVLKGPAAAALYGSRAANGVVLITTKSGKSGKAEISVNSRFVSNWANRLPEYQHRYKRGFYQQDGTLMEGDATTAMRSWGAAAGSGDVMYDNLGNFFQSANTWDNSVSLSGGSENGSFYLSAANFSSNGIVPNSDYEKTTFRFNGEQKYGILKMAANVAYSSADQLSSLTSGGLYGSSGEGAIQGAYIWPRDMNMGHWLNDDGTKYRPFDWELVQNDFDNPYWILNKMPRTDKVKRLTGSFKTSVDITDWWDVHWQVGIDRYTQNTTRFAAPGSGISLIYMKGMLAENDQTFEYKSSNLMTNFKKKFGDFDMNLMMGTMAELTDVEYNGRRAWNFIMPEFYTYLNTALTDRDAAQSRSDKRLVGLFGEYRVSYKDYAYLTFTGRNDWSSTLPMENRSYFYPSIQGSFIFSEFIPENNFLSYGKIRASLARVGKDTDPYVTNTYVNNPVPTLYNGGLGTGVRNAWLRGNAELLPEITEAQEYGIDFKFFRSRLGMEFTYYKNTSFNQLLQPRTSQATGYILMWTNAADIENRGLELTLTGSPIQRENFRWDVTVNGSRNKGRVNNLLPGLEVLYVTDVQVGNAKAASFNNGNFMGISGSEWLRSPEGHLVLNPESGMPQSDGLDTHEIGNRESRFFGGINNSLQYKDWNLSFLLDFRIGGDVYNGTEYAMTQYGMSKRSMDRESLSITGVVQEGTDANGAPIYSDVKTFDYRTGEMYTIGNQQVSGEHIISDYWWRGAYNLESRNYMTNTNWLRLRTISLSYSLPNSLLSRTKAIKRASATLTGTNLLLWTNYKGMDPETSAAGAGAVGSSSVGIDHNGIPALSGVTFGLNLIF
ncbi:SusC/RagA family TonB-linked outer membrane protein [Sphingobacterium gobiense]|uniref:SusC/RagA family TonB-linked outer membrane protein n=1 Tax=Sphingobacterium gobiense TaxID=1382456 RepID=A0A2S9JD21_9SPHI|nr:SusC/RagA family TonB-linked outer membrane protein [Sphingobacterium gobiense]PRD50772.1 SusC/RagA family TonB-linked outer membrane protein [Sphingobacterium gobiense]